MWYDPNFKRVPSLSTSSFTPPSGLRDTGHALESAHVAVIKSNQYSPRSSHWGQPASRKEAIEPSPEGHMEAKDSSETQSTTHRQALWGPLLSQGLASRDPCPPSASEASTLLVSNNLIIYPELIRPPSAQPTRESL